MILQYGKVWQTNDFKLVLQIKVPTEWQARKTLESNKFYLILDISQNTFGIYLSLVKPENIQPKHAFVERFRKSCKTGRVIAIERDSSGSLKLQIVASGLLYLLSMTMDAPPYFELIEVEAAVSLIRWGQKGTFTKKQTAPESTEGVDFLESLFAQYSHLEKDVEPEIEADEEESEQTVSSEQRQLAKKLKRKLKTLYKSLKKAESEVPTKNELMNLKNCSDQLKQYSYLVKPDMSELRLSSEYTGLDSELVIPIDPEKSIGQNIENLFILFKKRSRAMVLGEARLGELSKEIHTLESDIDHLRSKDMRQIDMDQLIQRYKISVQVPTSKTANATVKIPYKKYRMDTGWIILLGKGPKENDELTKHARGNDTWVHTSAVPGAHAIIPRQGQPSKEEPPASVIRAAGILSIHSSRLRNDCAGEVYVTEKNNIRKKKGLPAGTWLVDRSQTIFVRYDNDELKAILNFLVV